MPLLLDVYKTLANIVDVIEDEEELQPQWKALEHRITKRANKPKGTVRSGRGKRHPSAWDAESV